MNTVRIATPTCIHCRKTGVVEIEATDGQLDLFDKGIGNIQSIFPEVSKDIREQIISGTHPKCWDEMFS